MRKKFGASLEREHRFLVGADWDLEPSLVDSTGLPGRLDAALFAPKQRTCAAPTAATTIDFFMASTGVARAVESIDAAMSWAARPHRLVLLKVRDTAVHLHQLSYRTHKKLHVVLPVGPTPCPQDWTLRRCLAETAADAA
eukprot:8766730-Pyramimonas_sp.AAC.1